jgi:hypothetical protein
LLKETWRKGEERMEQGGRRKRKKKEKEKGKQVWGRKFYFLPSIRPFARATL